MECECKKHRNSDISLAILLFGAITLIIYLLLFSFKDIFNYKSDDILIWILIISILLAVIITVLIFIFKKYIYKN